MKESVSGRRIAIVCKWFPPEPAPIGQMMFELARYLAEHGLGVDVVTSVPSHPNGFRPRGWRNRLMTVERLPGNVRVLRVAAFPRLTRDRSKPPGVLWRIAAFLWFTFASTGVLCGIRRSSTLFSVLQPLLIAIPTLAVARVRGMRVVFNVQDLHPDALIQVGLVRNPGVIGLLRWMERTAYREADALSVICSAFAAHAVSRGARPATVEVIPNWIDTDEVRPLDRPSRLRSALGLEADDFVVLYAGTIGLVSGAEIVLDAAERLRHAQVHFVFVGEGQLMPRLVDQSRQRGLSGVKFLPFQPRAALEEVQALGDVSLVTLLPGHGRTSVPSKVLGYFAAGRPVIAAVDGDSETARLVAESGAGWVTPAGDADALAAQILSCARDQRARAAAGAAGRDLVVQRYSKPVVLAQYAKLFGVPSRAAE